MGHRLLALGCLALLLSSLHGCKPAAKPPAKEPAKPSTTAVSGDFQGNLGVVDESQIGGWAWDPSRPGEPVQLTIFDGDTPLLETSANVFRKDLLEIKIGNGQHGFSVATPTSLKDGRTHVVHVFIAKTKFELANSPKNFQSTTKAVP